MEQMQSVFMIDDFTKLTDNCVTNDYKETHFYQEYTTKSFRITALITAWRAHTHFKNQNHWKRCGVCDVLTSNTKCGDCCQPSTYF